MKLSGSLTAGARLSGSLNPGIRLESKLNVPTMAGINTYQGTYTVTPSTRTQTLNTEESFLNHNITIYPIPSNYGLITWNGSTLTVS